MSYKMIWTIYFGLVGLCIGSFLNVVIYRLPRKLSIAHGRSMCPKCEHSLAAIDLVPIFSFLFLRGKCRYCSAPISWRYPGVELLTGGLFALAGWNYLLTRPLYAAVLCVYFCALIIAWFIDLDKTFIPDSVHLIIVGVAVASWFCGPGVSLISRLIGGCGVGLLMLLISLVTHGGIGGGDIKLMAASGLLLGWERMLPAFFFAYILAFLRCLIPLLRGKMKAGMEVPMAPYFAVSLMVFTLFGSNILEWYLSVLL